MKKIITTSIAMAFAIISFSQTTPSWIKFSAPADFSTTDVSVGLDSAGNIYTTASVYDTITNHYQSMLVKHNPAGLQIWKKFYDNNDAASYNNGTQANSLLVDKAGNSYVCGQGRNPTLKAKDFMVIKYDNAGNQVWIRYTDGGQSEDDYVTCATFDAAGNILIGGNANFQGNTGYDIMVVKFNTAGVQQWSYLYDGTTHGEDVARAIATDANNNVFVTGNTYNVSNRSMITLKLNSPGAHQWTNIETLSNSSDQFGYGIATDAAGNCYVTGAVLDWVTYKYSPTGTKLWTNTYTTGTINGFVSKKVILDKAGNVMVMGNAFFSGGHFSDFVASKLNPATGVSIWSTSFDFGGSDNYTSATLDTLGNVYIGGYTDANHVSDICAVAISATGVVGWHTIFANTIKSTGSNAAYQIAVDNNRNVYLAGSGETRATGSLAIADVITIKYSSVAVGIKSEKPLESLLSIYPNPCSDKLHISATDKNIEGADISIINSLGEIVLTQKLILLENTIETGQLAKGIYIIQISNSQSASSKKLIIN